MEVLCGNDREQYHIHVFILYDHGGSEERRQEEESHNKRSPNVDIYELMKKPKVNVMKCGDEVTILELEYVKGSHNG